MKYSWIRPWLLLWLVAGTGSFAPQAPAIDILQQFDGPNSNDAHGVGGAPPDPHGAVGPSGVLASVNTILAYYPKRGDTNHAAIWEAPLALHGTGSFSNTPSFWAPNPGFGAAGSGHEGVSDPKVAYDPDLQRFFVIMQENPGIHAYVNVAVSRNRDPRTSTSADWFFYRWEVTEHWTVPIPILGGSLVDVAIGIDYPGIAVDRRVLVLSFNAFSLDEVEGIQGSALGSRVLVFDKRKLAAGLNDTPRSWSSQRPLGIPVNVYRKMTLQPVQPIGDADPGNRILLVELRLVDHILDPAYLMDEWCIRLHVFDDPLGRFEHDHDDIPISRPGPYRDWLTGPDQGAAQPGNAIHLDTLNKRCMNAIFFNGRVWTVYTQQPGNGEHSDPTVIRWLAIEPLPGQSELRENDFFDNRGAGNWLYMPAIGATPRGDLCIIYTESGPNTVPTFKARILQKNDPAWGSELTIKTSANASMGTPKAGQVYARWGDYAAVVPDPVDGSLWVTHEYVSSTEINNWNTTWAQLAACNFPVAGAPQDNLVTNCATPASFTAGALDLFGDPLPATTVGYQWRRNGIALTNASHYQVATNLTSTKLDVLTPGFTDEGWYDVEVSNDCGTRYATVSEPALLVKQRLPTWATVDAGIQPLNRINHRMVHIPPHGYFLDATLLFGGEVYDPNPLHNGRFTTNDMWRWFGTNGWSRWDFPNPPPPRAQHAMAYDSKRERLVVFGGLYNDSRTNIVYGDTWEWDGSQWQQRFPSNSPPARYNHAMAFDSVRGETLLIGGYLNAPEVNQTWAWDGTNWFLRSTNVPPRLTSTYLGPYSVYNGVTMAFDEHHGAAVLFGPFGASTYQVWEWAGGTWVANEPAAASDPGVLDSRGGCAFYDSSRGMVGFAGASPYLYYWRPQTGTWPSRYYRFNSLVDGATDYLPSGAQVVYDAGKRALLQFGGGYSFYNDPPRTRVLAFSDNPVIFQNPIATNVFPGQAITLRAGVTGGGCGPLYYTWYHNGQAVPASARYTGIGTPTLGINSSQGSDNGTYQLVIGGASGDLSTTPVRVGVGPVLNWGFTTNSLRLRWTAPTAVLEEAPSPTGPWTPHPGWLSPMDIPTTGNDMRFFRLNMP